MARPRYVHRAPNLRVQVVYFMRYAYVRRGVTRERANCFFLHLRNAYLPSELQ